MTTSSTSAIVTGSTPTLSGPAASTPTMSSTTVSSLTVNTDAVTQFARRLDELAHDIDAWVLRARLAATYDDPARHQTLESASDRCARAADHIRAHGWRAHRAAAAYDANESWWAAPPHLGITALAGVAAFLAPSPLTVSVFRRSITGISGVMSGAAEIASAGARALGASPAALSVRPVARTECLSPASFTAAVARIPAADPHRPQVRIEKTPSAAFVYIGGTVTGNLSGGREPWDMASNIAAIAGQVSDSERGVRTVMAASGVTSADRIVVVGHSQGGLVAQRLAADPELRVSDVVLVGSPQTAGGVAAGVHVVALEHSNDPIPALGGIAPEGRADVTVARTPLIESGDPLAAHHLSAYRELASEADASRTPALINARREVFGNEQAACQATVWRVDRVR